MGFIEYLIILIGLVLICFLIDKFFLRPYSPPVSESTNQKSYTEGEKA